MYNEAFQEGGGGYAVALLVFSVRLPVNLVVEKCHRWFSIKFCETQFFSLGLGGGGREFTADIVPGRINCY